MLPLQENPCLFSSIFFCKINNMSSPFKRIAPVDQIDAIFMTDEDVGAQLEAEDPELKAFKEYIVIY